MTRPAGRVKGVSKSRRSGRVITLSNFTGRVESGQEVSQSRGSGRVGPIGFKISRVGSGQEVSKSRGSGRVGSRGFQNPAGRVGS